MTTSEPHGDSPVEAATDNVFRIPLEVTNRRAVRSLAAEY
jgi:hypothetical protein